uniref:Uncharacterized protein n=1 Tax=Zea mays TaxID=4577 RepID=A0A804R733_MAIZE
MPRHRHPRVAAPRKEGPRVEMEGPTSSRRTRRRSPSIHRRARQEGPYPLRLRDPRPVHGVPRNLRIRRRSPRPPPPPVAAPKPLTAATPTPTAISPSLCKFCRPLHPPRTAVSSSPLN